MRLEESDRRFRRHDGQEGDQAHDLGRSRGLLVVSASPLAEALQLVGERAGIVPMLGARFQSGRVGFLDIDPIAHTSRLLRFA